MFHDKPKLTFNVVPDDSRAKVMRYIEEHFMRHNEPPTIREICAATGLSSTDTVHYHVEQLIATGHLTRLEGHGPNYKGGRTLRLTNKRYFF